MNNLLLASLQCSGLLAERALVVTPDLSLSWNPRQAESTITAVNSWLEHVNNNLFWVETACRNLDEAMSHLTIIHLQPEGFNYFYEESFHNYYPGTLGRLLMAFLELEHALAWGDVDEEMMTSGDSAYQEVYEQWGFEEVVPLYKICQWVEERLAIGQVRPGANATLLQVFDFPNEIKPFHDETPEIWQGFANLLRWMGNNTGYDILDWANDDDGNEYLYEMRLDWLDPNVTAELHNSWLHAKRFINRRDKFQSWADSNSRNLKRVVLVMKTACREVLSSGWEDPLWSEILRKSETIRSGWYDDELSEEEE